MAIYLVTYDLRQPGRNYAPVFQYLQRYEHCKGMESVWLIEAAVSLEGVIRDGLRALCDQNDRLFVTRLYPHEWASWNYTCGEWLNAAGRSW